MSPPARRTPGGDPGARTNQSLTTTTYKGNGSSDGVTRVGNFARRRAEHEARDLARQIAAEARAFLAGDRGAAFDLHRLAGQLAVLVLTHALDLEEAS